MIVSQRKLYSVTLGAPKGKRFSTGELLRGNYLDEDDINTLKISDGQQKISWTTTVNYDLTNEEYIEIFSPALIDAGYLIQNREHRDFFWNNMNPQDNEWDAKRCYATVYDNADEAQRVVDRGLNGMGTLVGDYTPEDWEVIPQ